MNVQAPSFVRQKYCVGSELRALASPDRRGRPKCGRTVEIAALRRAGHQNPSVGRIYEGHVNAVQLVARYGNDGQRLRLERELAAGHLFAVWNTQDADGVTLDRATGRDVLHGAKTWASGAGTITRALITAVTPERSLQMCLMRMDCLNATIDESQWHPLGMNDSDSFRVDFNGIAVEADDLIGRPDAYETQPWFFGGALRFLAVQTGIAERIVNETTDYLLRLGRGGDTSQRIRVAQMRTDMWTCIHWLTAGIVAWERFDAQESAVNADAILDVVDMARSCIERAALDILEAAVRCVGARGLVEPLPLARLIRDLQMYLRQPAPDAVVLRIGDAAFREAQARASIVTASSTGMSS